MPADVLPCPAGELEAVTSSMINFEPKTLVLKKPIDVTLQHHGPLHTAHYENVAMGYNDATNAWEQIQGIATANYMTMAFRVVR